MESRLETAQPQREISGYRGCICNQQIGPEPDCYIAGIVAYLNSLLNREVVSPLHDQLIGLEQAKLPLLFLGRARMLLFDLR
ncbi:hypothetical protein ASD14_00730 [Lysobacter sp. Root494]|nr:hypothetical protein ASD14_00730 [Lysobacter sp. Root494]